MGNKKDHIRTESVHEKVIRHHLPHRETPLKFAEPIANLGRIVFYTTDGDGCMGKERRWEREGRLISSGQK